MRIALLCLFFGLSTFSYGETIDVEYASFYSHVKKLQDENTQALRFAFGFKHIVKPGLCEVLTAKIVTQKQTLPLVVEGNYRFTVPTDKILKMAKALVLVDIEDQANQCDMSVQLETKPQYLSVHYSDTDLEYLLKQYQAFFNDMGGIFSFMMPEVDGLVFHFDSSTVLSDSQLGRVKDNRLTLNLAQIKAKPELDFPVKPIRITASIEK
ncbi:MAG: DUF2987 domain-containing protein [Paraglaciecola sp.]|uniref:DUF2987 domain-containing protein n=2 Tax=Paraglaciecola sp. TaxID=1920173 RepID=UPI003299DF6E